jgi:murein DD-endopeptidase MepM/ murein hydrolase activator NlpD
VNLRAALVLIVIASFTPSILPAATPPVRSKPRPKSSPTPPPPRVAAAEKDKPKSVPPVVHEVNRGESLSSIAKKYKVTVASLVIANRLRGPRAKLSPGQRLRILHPGSAPAPPLRARRGPVDEPLPLSLVLGVPEFDDAPNFQWPVTGPVTSTFGRRWHSWHRGLDIRADPGTPIVAAASGVVVASGFEPRYGQRVTIEHEGGFATVYAHNERNLVDVGQAVAGGQVIAIVGRTGRATGEHVHFEIRYDGRVYNPLYLLPLPPRPIQVELATSDPHDEDE